MEQRLTHSADGSAPRLTRFSKNPTVHSEQISGRGVGNVQARFWAGILEILNGHRGRFVRIFEIRRFVLRLFGTSKRNVDNFGSVLTEMHTTYKFQDLFWKFWWHQVGNAKIGLMLVFLSGF